MYNRWSFSFWYRNMWYFKDRQTVDGGEVDGANSSLRSFIELFSFISDNCHPKGTWSPFIFNWYHIKRNFFFKKGTHWQSLVYSPIQLIQLGISVSDQSLYRNEKWAKQRRHCWGGQGWGRWSPKSDSPLSAGNINSEKIFFHKWGELKSKICNRHWESESTLTIDIF